MPDGSLAGYSAPGLAADQRAAMDRHAPTTACSRSSPPGNGGEIRFCPPPRPTSGSPTASSRYGEAMYAEQSAGVAGLHKALEDFAVGALMFEDATPISQAGHLGAYSDRYRSIVADKGRHGVSHAARRTGRRRLHGAAARFLQAARRKDRDDRRIREIGRVALLAAQEGRAARESGLLLLAMARIRPACRNSPWITSSIAPRRVFRSWERSIRISTRFACPSKLRSIPRAIPRRKRFLVTGTTSQFQIDTFGRPKPNGITIDPNNNLLKSSPRLRVRATVARGESAGLGRQVLRGHSGISTRARRSADQFARALPHGRGHVLPEKLSGRRQLLFARR